MDSCLYCAVDPRDSPPSKEHIVPEVLGGWETYSCVCEFHNNHLGSDLESKLKTNAFVAHALHEFGLQPLYKAFRHGSVIIETPDGREMHGTIKDAIPKLRTQPVSEDEWVTSEEDAKTILRKRIERLEKKGNSPIYWRDDDFDSVPYDQLCHIPNTDIAFTKRKGGPGFVRFDGLHGSIPFRVPAKIAVTHLAALGCPFVQNPAFDPLKMWILQGGENQFALLGRRLDALEPCDLDCKPFHYIKYRFVAPHLLALVTLFSAIRFGVYLAELPEMAQWQHLPALDRYHVYDLRKKVVFPSRCEFGLEEDHIVLMDAVLAWRLHAGPR